MRLLEQNSLLALVVDWDQKPTAYNYYNLDKKPKANTRADWFKIVFLLIRLWARDFYRVIVDEGAARINYQAEKSRANYYFLSVFIPNKYLT